MPIANPNEISKITNVELANKVLIVEDNHSIADVLRHSITTTLQLESIYAESLRGAKLALETRINEIFVAVLDLNLPDAPNGEIVEEVLKYGLPIIILTAENSEQTRDSMMALPIVDYVIKRNANELAYVTSLLHRIHKNRSIKVLIVDNSKAQRQLMRYLLERQLFQVLEAGNGHEAITVIEQNPDTLLMITDQNMPNMTGLELIVHLRDTYPRNELAIIGLSSDASKKMTVQLLKGGANDYINRPYLNEELYCRINQNIEAIENFTTLREAATKDFLTGLHNRKYVFETGEVLFQNAKRDNMSLCVAMIDIDFFKKVNDTYGHHIGDIVLQHFSALLKKQLRDADMVARVGGEEFCIICVNITKENAKKLFNRIRDAVMKSPVNHGKRTISFTISIGFSLTVNQTLSEMIDDADQGLYAAKEGGRNRVICLN